MAQRAKTTRTTKASPTGRPRGRPPGSKANSKPKKAAPAPVAKKTRQPATAKPVAATRPAHPSVLSAPLPKPSKDELRVQVEKLERTVATLRARSREAVRAAKQAAARIEELEAQLAAKEEQAVKRPAAAAAAAPAAKHAPKPAPKADRQAMPKVAAQSSRGRRLSAGGSPGDAAPPGITAQAPEPMDEEATAAPGSLDAELHLADT